MRNGRNLGVMLAIAMLFSVACTNSSAGDTPTPAPPTRSVPVQPPADPFDLVATIFPSTPTAASAIPTPSLAPTSTPLSDSASALRATPTPLDAGPGKVLFETNIGFGGPLPTFDGESFWFADGPFAVRASIDGEVTGRFQVARADPPQLAFADGHIWALDVAEGQLRKVTLEGETVLSIPAQFASRLDVSVDSIYVYSQITSRMTRFDFDGEKVSEFNLRIFNQLFSVTEDRIWTWNWELISGYSYDGKLEIEWEVPLGEINDNPISDLQVSEEYVWLFGSPFEVFRIGIESGTVTSLNLAMEQGEFRSGASAVTGGLVLENSVWVIYTRSMVPFGEPGSVATEFRRLEVFDFDGNVLGEREFDEGSFDLTLGKVSVLGEVWMVLAGSPRQTLFQRLPIDGFVPPESRFTAEQLAVPVFPGWLDPETAQERPDDEAIFAGWEEYLSGNALIVSDRFAYHFCEDGPLVLPGNGPMGFVGSPFVAPRWGIGAYEAGSALDWGTVSTIDTPLRLQFERKDGGFLFRSQVGAVLSPSTICLSLD